MGYLFKTTLLFAFCFASFSGVVYSQEGKQPVSQDPGRNVITKPLPTGNSGNVRDVETPQPNPQTLPSPSPGEANPGQIDPYYTNASPQVLNPNTSQTKVSPGIKGDYKAKITLQGNHASYTPEWIGTYQVTTRSDLNKSVEAPVLNGGRFDNQVANLPYVEVKILLNDREIVNINTINTEGEQTQSSNNFELTIREYEGPEIDTWYPKSHVVLGPRLTEKGQQYQIIQLYPMLIGANGMEVKKVTKIDFDFSKRLGPSPVVGNAKRTTVNNSVLSNGDWYKIGVLNDGVYKLDANFLSSLGINVNAIDPRQIKIYGNGGAPLPQMAGDFRYDDLHENPIFVQGEADGSFGSGDYVLFYGASPHQWKWSSKYSRYIQYTNFYSDTTFYFLSVGPGSGERIQTINSEGGITYTPTSTTDWVSHEKDEFNALLSGRVWLGESFDLTTTRTFSLPLSGLTPGSFASMYIRVAARSNNATNYFTIKEGGALIHTLSVTNVTTNIYGSYYYRTNYKTLSIPAGMLADGSADIELTYNKPAISDVGWLDFIQINYQRDLYVNSPSSGLFLTATENTGPGAVYGFNIGNMDNSYMIWDITDPVNISGRGYTLSGSTASFGVSCPTKKRFYAFNGASFKTPVTSKKIGNQNLHALSQADFIIITGAELMTPANELAQLHRNHPSLNQSVHLVKVEEIYNEFSSGHLDPSGIRDFIKMFYDRAATLGNAPKYVLMLGDGSYDYKRREEGDFWYIPTYQSRKSQRPTESYTSDDFFGFLDDNEGWWGEASGWEGGNENMFFLSQGDTLITTHALDVGIGRIPCSNAQEAQVAVNKIIEYVQGTADFGPWRSKITLVADHKNSDGVTHVSQANSYDTRIAASNPCMNVDKLYMDNYEMTNTASGTAFPEGKEALLQKIDDGSLIVNYTGHGGETGWSNSRILELQDINNIDNGGRLPAYVTATCEFGRWDDPGRKSAAEVIFLKEEGGSIAMFTTVRVVYSGPNYVLNSNFYNYSLKYDSVAGEWPRMGEVFRRTKNDSWMNGINNRNFTLMGDPAIPLNYPKLAAVITKINGNTVVPGVVDSLPSLSLVTIEGEIRDNNNQFIPGFNGDMYITVFDKPTKFVTKLVPYTFYWQKNRVFNGTVSVSGGKFTISFVVPIDVSYEEGNAKISLYFDNMATDGAGCSSSIYIGGTGNISDNTDPILDVFINDEKFADGGMVGPDPLLLADVYDENGINTVGTGIGHELTGILDGNQNDVIVLNDFYTANKDSYKDGHIEYNLKDLAEGEHTITVKVWDVANNSAEKTITFIVSDNGEMALGHVLNYPNPFSTHTQFFIEHNQNGRFLDARVEVYTVSGRLVKTLFGSFYAEGNIYCDLVWDGTDEWGDVIGRGAYVYKVSLKDPDSGKRVTKFEKLVMLR